MVEVISLDRAFAGELGDLSVERVEVSGEEDHGGAHGKEPVVIPAEVQQDSADGGGDESEPGDGVGIYVDESLRDRCEGELCIFSVLV